MSRLRTNIVTVGLFSAAALLPLSAAKAEQVGSASWYALTSRTASGEMMDPSAMTAAHPSLPFGTKVLVENLTNGQSVVVRINDRGPFVGSRIIDVSKAAASSLGMIGSGVAKVRVAAIGGGGETPIQTASAEKPRGAMAVAMKTTSVKAVGKKIVVAKAELRREPSVRKQVVASYEKAHAKRLGREIAWAQSRHGGRKPVELASASNSYAILGSTPGFMEKPDQAKSRRDRG
jgi:peptidoglycan lytic transglycosylase